VCGHLFAARVFGHYDDAQPARLVLVVKPLDDVAVVVAVLAPPSDEADYDEAAAFGVAAQVER
jgi:hypothetical protein